MKVSPYPPYPIRREVSISVRNMHRMRTERKSIIQLEIDTQKSPVVGASSALIVVRR